MNRDVTITMDFNTACNIYGALHSAQKLLLDIETLDACARVEECLEKEIAMRERDID